METSKLLTEHEAARYLSISVATIRAWRCTRRVNLRYYKIGRKAVRYSIEDLDIFLKSSAVGGEPCP